MSQEKYVHIALGAIVALASLSIVLFMQNNYILGLCTQAIIFAILALSLQLIFGVAGQISLAHAGFYGIGAYTSAIATMYFGIPWLLAFVLAGLVSSLCSLVLTPMAKLGEMYMSMATLAFNLSLIIIFANGGHWTGGWNGLIGVPWPKLFGWVVEDRKDFFVLSCFVLLLAFLFMTRLIGGRLGRNFRAIRDNQLAASSLGINIGSTKTKGFVIGCFWAGLAGSLAAHSNAFVSPEPFGIGQSFTIFIMVVIGGLGSFLGAVFGAFGIVFLDEVLETYPIVRPVLYGGIIILFMIYLPGGLSGLAKMLFRRWSRSTQQLEATEKPEVARATFVDTSLLDTYLDAAGRSDASVLDVRGVTKRFGGVVAVNNVSLSVMQGEVFSLIGPNGAGKTSLINIITGLETPTMGTVLFEGRPLKPGLARASACGMVRTFQTSKLFGSMTVLENVLAGMAQTVKNDVEVAFYRGSRFAEEERKARLVALELLRLVGLDERKDDPSAHLSYGSQRRLEIARALATNPKMLLLDEPAAGLNLKERADLRDLIVTLRDRYRITIFIVEHDLQLLTQITDHIAVLNFGKKIADGTLASVLDDPDVIQAYLGKRERIHAAA